MCSHSTPGGVATHSKKSVEHVKRAYRIAHEVQIEFSNFYLIGGYRFPENLANQIETSLKFKYLGKISPDERLDEYVLTGQSLLDLPLDSVAYTSVKEIMKNAGYL